MQISVDSLETAAVTKAHLADMLFDQLGLNKRESKDMVDAFFDLVSAQLQQVFRSSRARRSCRQVSSFRFEEP